MEHPQRQLGHEGQRTEGEQPTSDEDLSLSELFRKASVGDVDYLQRLDGRRVLLAQDPFGDTALHWASRFGHLEFVDEILSRFQMPSPEGDGIPPHPHSERVLLLTNKHGDASLHEAIRHKHVAIAMRLLEADPQLVADTCGNPTSLLYLAAENALEQVVLHLLSRPEARDDGPNGATALHAAVKSRGKSTLLIVTLLLSIRPNLRSKPTSHGDLPLHHAALLGDDKIVRELLEDADGSSPTTVYRHNKDGNTPIHLAAMAGHVRVVRLLIDKFPDGGAVVNGRRMNALHLAIKHGRGDVVQYILQEPRLRVLVYQRDEDGNGPLHLAALHWDPGVFEPLLDDPKVDKLAKNRNDQTALDVFPGKHGPQHTQLWETVIDCRPWAPMTHSPLFSSLLYIFFLYVSQYFTRWRLREAVPYLPATEDNIQEEVRWDQELRWQANREIMSQVEKERGNIMNMATLVAAVTFAAAFTVPGGYRSDSGAREGRPILLRAAAFKVFIVFDVITMGTSLAALFLCVYAMWELRIVHTVRHPVRRAARLLMMFSFAGMATAFAAGMYTILAPEAQWLAVIVCAMCGGLPVLAYVRILRSLFFPWELPI